ncbi:Coiled-coil domain-containing protein 113 [Mytilus edulis]|uniref:Cilia- and flagella-associated protein 263 n=1 Tax=Mytilus edulis TaxID=6550 RepID=A0A8S3V7N4_MYTED|nr:Coiled-coil domain-containing protein 113 [Mytilus edulis]
MADSESMSLDTSNEAGDDPLMDLNDEQLDKLIQQKMIENQVLQNETQMFEKYLKKSEPKDSGGALGGIGAGLTVSSSNQDLSRGMNRKRSKSRGANLDKSLRLTTEQKCDIAQKKLDDLKEDIEKYRDNCEIIDNFTLGAIMEECELTLSETKKESYEFERDILKGADTLVEKLRLKNTVKSKKMKLDLQFKQKEEMGEALHEVDFQQLKIENEQYLEKIDEKNTELMDLKLKASKSLQVLNSYKSIKISSCSISDGDVVESPNDDYLNPYQSTD